MNSLCINFSQMVHRGGHVSVAESDFRDPCEALSTSKPRQSFVT